MIVDAISVRECGPDSVTVNALIQSKVDMKNLRLGTNFYFEMTMLFRQSMLINSILFNSEALYWLNNTQIETIESVDRYLWRNVFGAMVSTPIESYYIEKNSIPIRFIVKGRRLMYYWNLLQNDDTELVIIFLNTQSLLPSKND